MSIQIATRNGTSIELTASHGSVQAALTVSGRAMEFSSVKLAHDDKLGAYLALANSKALIREEDLASVKALYAEAEEQSNAAREAYKASNGPFHSRMQGRMYGRNSNH